MKFTCKITKLSCRTVKFLQWKITFDYKKIKILTLKNSVFEVPKFQILTLKNSTFEAPKIPNFKS
jgi:hypothetical protein